MMAFDRSPPPELDPALLEELRTALAASVGRQQHVDGLGDLLCRTADDARSKGMQAEHLLIVLKGLWHSLPEIRVADRETESGLLQELISRCIQEYYSL